MSSALENYAEKEHYSYADYLEWDEDVRAELIRGNVYMMSPPLTVHQRIAGRLYVKLANYLEGKTCEAFIAPFAVRLFPKEDKSDNSVVEPDIVVVCDSAKIDERGCNGPPDLVIEIQSPSNSRKNRILKFNLYLEAKVREYWVVYPEENGIDVHLYDKGHYTTRGYAVNDSDVKENERAPEIVPVTILPGLEIDVKDIFREKL